MVEASLNDMSIDKFKLWTQQALKSYLYLRGQSTEGNFETLVSRAFVTWENNVDVNPMSEHCMRKNLSDYKDKLLVSSDPLPDPFTLTDWYGEDGKQNWPRVYFSDIAMYLQSTTVTELCNRLINEYKQGKGFRMFTDNHVGEVFYHPISPKSTTGFLSARVKPSMKSTQPYQVWVAVEKPSINTAGGKILTAYCTCTAGLHGSCNHVAGILFKIEYFTRTGLEPSCTSVLSKWNVPAKVNGGDLIPKPIVDYTWKKRQYFNQDHDDHQTSVQELSTNFTPLSENQQKYANSDQIVDDFANAFTLSAPDSCFVQMHFAKPFPHLIEANCPPAPVDVARALSISPPITETDKDALKKALQLSADQRSTIEVMTRQQASSEIWSEQRRGRITASKIRSVYTRSLTLIKDRSANPTAVIQEVMGYKPIMFQTQAMKHGSSSEEHAKLAYKKQMKKIHKKFQSVNSGLLIHQDHSFLAASPDLITTCECHGKGLCEIKCPFSIRNERPSHENWSHLKLSEGKSSLSKSSPHYNQIQAQMAIAGCTFCDLFVYTSCGSHIERIPFDPDLWEHMVVALQHLYNKYIIPELITGETAPKMNLGHEISGDHTYAKQEGVQEIQPGPSFRRRSLLTKPLMAEVYLCGVCGEDVPEGSDDFRFQSVVCSECTRWFHFYCLNFTQSDVDSLPDKWFCDGCV